MQWVIGNRSQFPNKKTKKKYDKMEIMLTEETDTLYY